MFVLAIHSEKQHMQAVLAPKGIVLRQLNGRWELAPPPAVGIKGDWIEVLPQSADHQIRCSKQLKIQSEQLFQSSKSCFRLNFKVGDTCFEISQLNPAGQTNAVLMEPSSFSPFQNETIKSLFRWNVDTEEDLRLAVTLIVESLGCESSGIVRWDSSCQSWQIIGAAYRSKQCRLSIETQPFDVLLSDPSSHEYLTDSERSVFTPWFDGRGKLLGALVGRTRIDEVDRQSSSQLAYQLEQLGKLVSSRKRQRDQAIKARSRKQLLVESFGEQQDVFNPVVDSKTDDREGTALVLQLPNLPNHANRLDDLERILSLSAEVVSQKQGKIVCFQSGKLTTIWEAQNHPGHLALACETALDLISRFTLNQQEGNPTVSIGVSTGKLLQRSYLGRIRFHGKAIRKAQRLAELAKELNLTHLVADDPKREQLNGFEYRPLCRAKLMPNEVATTIYQFGYPGDQLQTADIQKNESEIFSIPAAVA